MRSVDITMRNGDRRLTEYWLQEALELSFYRRFCTKGAQPAALILHGRRARDLADFALMDSNRALTLIEIKKGSLNPSEARSATAQLAKYVGIYEAMTVADHADRYCRHNVGVASWFEYGKPESLIPDPNNNTVPKHPKDVRDYGRLTREGAHNFHVYREGANDPEAAWQILAQDFGKIVGGNLDGLKPSDRLKVVRCILVAESLDENVELGTAADIPVEFWRYLPPTEWVGPA